MSAAASQSCCCCPQCSTSACAARSSELELVISGVVNTSPVDCADCGNHNGTYIFTCYERAGVPPGPGANAYWVHTLETPTCTAEFFDIEKSVGGASGILSMYAFTVTGGNTWLRKTSVGTGCDSFAGVVMTVGPFPPSYCDWSGATGTVNSL